MATVKEGVFQFSFPKGFQVSQPDRWSFYRNRFQRVAGGTKCVDLLAVKGSMCWLVEVKDYRRHRRTKNLGLAEEVACKARDCLALLATARANAAEPAEKAHAAAALGCTRYRIVLHLEQSRKATRLFPRAFDPGDVQDRLKRLVKAIDPHPRVWESDRMGSAPWSVAIAEEES